MLRRRQVRVGFAFAAALLAPILPGSAMAGAAAAIPSDFNGDGYADLAIGARSDAMRGSVNVLYGGPTGLTAMGDQRWTQDSPGVLNHAERKDLFGDAVASGDFDADGYADLAIGVPGEGTNGTARAGAIEVLYGSGSGLTAAGDQLWTIENLPGGSDLRWLGAALASADVNGDGYWDLAAGAPNTANLDGAVVVLFGSPDGLTAEHLVRYDRSATGAEDDPTIYYGFGNVLASGDLDDDGYSDLAAGFGANGTLGEAVIVHGSAAGPVTAEAELWSQAVPGMEQGFDQAGGFGAALAIADFDGDGYDDLAAGAPGERGAVDPMNKTAAGGVNVIYGSADGLTVAGNQLWRQSSEGVPGRDEAWDSFGTAVAAGYFNADDFADLAIGVPGEDAEDFSFGPGAVTILYGSAEGLTESGAQRWSQASPGIPSNPQLEEWFGRTLVSHDFGRSGRDDLAIGVPNEGVGGVNHAGMVEVLYSNADGVSAGRAQAWTWATPGVKGPLTNDYFGLALGG